MFKWERKLAELIDRHLPALGFLIVTLMIVFMHRAGYWHTSFDLQSHFYPDLPEYLHTPFYTLLLRSLPIFSNTPVVLLKKIICLFDFVAALGAVYLLKQKNADKTAMLACYALLLVSPLTIENGLIWIHTDSVCMAAFLWSLVLYKRKHSILAGILLGAGAAILPQYAVLFLFPALYAYRKAKTMPATVSSNDPGKYLFSKIYIFPAVGIATAILLNTVSIGVLGLNLQKGLFMLINWLVISPENGKTFSGLIPWLKAMPAYFGYMTGTLALILAFLKPKYRIPAAVIHVLLLLYIGTILQRGW